ncbi:hypothetical protein RB2654_14840 [Rhodobacterales bacterium HTCC2654]|uniref:Uncharacterized protein n=1 Tax=Maritimibacter alkaliphilus HTCC2654 TaxID=314271 RepID=A3VH17_9RHOB|nr:hypothetical protein RB2654_14840 [Rhodobacterales bacterium HTCC2654] [Maritimibacter alkaliphilus HTCC2654]
MRTRRPTPPRWCSRQARPHRPPSPLPSTQRDTAPR